jgi:hypothetical protein
MYSIDSHDLCNGTLLSLDETTLPEEYTNYSFVNPSNNNGVEYDKVRSDKEPPLPLPRQDFGVFDDACVPVVYQGCTPGYWKIKSNDKDHCWCSYYYDNPLLTMVFDPAALALYNKTRKNSEGFTKETLDNALDFKGGGDLEGAARKLLRHGTAALLNACTLNGGGNYPVDADVIIADINAALASQTPKTINDLKNRYGCWNEGLPCTIDANCRDKEPPLDPPVLTCEDEDVSASAPASASASEVACGS